MEVLPRTVTRACECTLPGIELPLKRSPFLLVLSSLRGYSRVLRSRGTKLVINSCTWRYVDPGIQGDSFAINVINELNDTRMDVVTSIVSILGPVSTQLFMSVLSIGTVSINMGTTSSTVAPS